MRHITTALIGDVFEEIHRVTDEIIQAGRDENLHEALTSLRDLSAITLRLKKCWLRFLRLQQSAENLETIAELYFIIQNVNYYDATRFHLYFEDSLKEMFKFFSDNPELELNMAQTMSLIPHEALTESFKSVDLIRRKLTNEIVEDNLFFLAQGAILNNMKNCYINGWLVFYPANA